MEDRINQAIVQTHINTLQNIISRMSNSSSNCKTWAITLTTGLIILLFDKIKTCYYYVIYFPLVLFYILDSYYLGLERIFREFYNTFINEIQSNNETNLNISISTKYKKFKNFKNHYILFLHYLSIL